MANHPCRCNQHIAVDCYMGDDHVDDTIGKLVTNGLKHREDFVVFDATRLTMSRVLTSRREPIDTGVPLLRATSTGEEMYVWYDHTYPKNSRQDYTMFMALLCSTTGNPSLRGSMQ